MDAPSAPENVRIICWLIDVFIYVFMYVFMYVFIDVFFTFDLQRVPDPSAL